MSIQNLAAVWGEPEKTDIFLRSKQEVPMSDRFASLHCPSTGLLCRSQARTKLSKVFNFTFMKSPFYNFNKHQF
jgi:hypothetical protein